MTIVLGVLLAARKQRFDRLTLAALCAALGLYYVHFYHTTWDAFTLDAQAHADYVRYVALHHRLPTVADETPAARHPPTYYIMAAALYTLGQYEGASEPLLIARHLSVACFMIFILYGVNLLRLFLSPPAAGYYCALGLLLFWPIGVTMSGRITCDSMLYAAQAGVLYYLAAWTGRKTPSYLSAAFIAAGISILAKNTGVIMLGLATAVLLAALYQTRHALRPLLRLDLGLSVAFALGCGYLTFSHGWVTGAAWVEETHAPYYWVQSFGAFNPYLFIMDTGVGDSRGMFWNMLLHSLLLGEVINWKTTWMLIAFNLCWLAILLYLLKAFFSPRPVSAEGRNTARIFTLYAAMTVAARMYMAVRTGNILYADGRYLYPVVIGVALAYGKAVDANFGAGRTVLYKTGIALAACFVLLTLAVFFVQYR